MLLQVPGGLELLIVLLVMALLVGVPVVLAALFLFVRFVGGGDDSDEVAELRGRIEELEAQVGAGNEGSVEDTEASGAERPASSAEEDGIDEGGDR